MILETGLDLEALEIGMVTQFPLDCMHLLDLGVTKKILLLLLRNKSTQHISSSTLTKMSSTFVSFAPYITMEFARKPRGLDEIHRWKSVEFRQFALYTSIVLLKDFINIELYNHFCLFFVGYRMFLDNSLSCSTQRGYYFEKFVQDFPDLYGRENVSYNIHNMLHVSKNMVDL